MKKIRKIDPIFVLLLASIFLLPTSVLYAADAGMIQLSVAAPDPVVAGEDVTFQVITVNTGSNQWPAGQYYVETEIYDAQKNFLAFSTWASAEPIRARNAASCE